MAFASWPRMSRHPRVLLALLALLVPAVVSADKADAERKAKLQQFVGWADTAMHDAQMQNGPPDGDAYKWCLKSYDDAIAAGVPPTEEVTVRGTTGTIEEIRNKWCQGGKAKFDEAEDKRTAPFRKVLKNDKLAMALKDADAIVLPGGSGTDDPNKLAAAPVWFIDTSPPEHCRDGRQLHRVHRYQFSADHKLRGTTDHDYCGAPPSSAFK
jgi:hypothetical protein